MTSHPTYPANMQGARTRVKRCEVEELERYPASKAVGLPFSILACSSWRQAYIISRSQVVCRKTTIYN